MTDTAAPVIDLGLDTETLQRAQRNLADGTASWVVMSGKMCSGKDTLAGLLVERLPGLPKIYGYGNLMRAQLEPILPIVRQAYLTRTERSAVVAETAAEMAGITREHAIELVELAAAEIASRSSKPLHPVLDRVAAWLGIPRTGVATVSAWDRTDGIRTLLQKVGQEWHLGTDPGYWARRAAAQALEAVAAGESVIFTGGRTLEDVEIPRAFGAALLRLDVTIDTQISRLSGRDGIAPSPATVESLSHATETALDDYPHFTARISNDTDDIEATLAAIVEVLRPARAQAA